jgi:isocitrate dehydrogenase
MPRQNKNYGYHHRHHRARGGIQSAPSGVKHHASSLPYYYQHHQGEKIQKTKKSPMEQRFSTQFLLESKKKADKLLKYQHKQNAANHRRKLYANYQVGMMKYKNNLQQERSKNAISNKWKNEVSFERKAFEMKNKTEESVSLQKVIPDSFIFSCPSFSI